MEDVVAVIFNLLLLNIQLDIQILAVLTRVARRDLGMGEHVCPHKGDKGGEQGS